MNAYRVERQGKLSTPIWLLVVPPFSLQWRHNERDEISNQQPHDCLLNHLFRRRSKKTPRHWPFCVGNSPVTGEFPAQRASNAGFFPFDDVIISQSDSISNIKNWMFFHIKYTVHLKTIIFCVRNALVILTGEHTWQPLALLWKIFRVYFMQNSLASHLFAHYWWFFVTFVLSDNVIQNGRNPMKSHSISIEVYKF